MAGQVEHSLFPRSPYPSHWGRPQGEPFTEARAAWIRRQVNGDPQQALRKVERRRPKRAGEWLAELATKRYRRT